LKKKVSARNKTKCVFDLNDFSKKIIQSKQKDILVLPSLKKEADLYIILIFLFFLHKKGNVFG